MAILSLSLASGHVIDSCIVSYQCPRGLPRHRRSCRDVIEIWNML
jgi:hypothetical protein